MEEEAEVRLLEQHLLKTRQISQKMTTILSKFDHRLIKLEKSVAPLHENNEVLTRRMKNIDATLASIKKLSNQGDEIAAEENLILRGPKPEDLRLYTDAIERINANILLQGGGRAAVENARLVETGAKKLASLFTKLVAESSSGSPPISIISPTSTLPSSLAPTPNRASAPFSPSSFNTLTPLVASLRKLPLPATHPSHPASNAIGETLGGAQRGYGEMRGGWGRKCLEGGSRRVMDRVETGADRIDAYDGIEGDNSGVDRGAEMFVNWVRECLDVCDSEYGHLRNLAPLPSSVPSTFSSLLSPILSLISSSFNQLTNLIKKDLPRYTFLALSVYSLLQGLQDPWDTVIISRIDRQSNLGNELKDVLGVLRGICVRSFPEVFVDVQTAALPSPGAGREADIGTSVASITSQIVRYLNQLPYVLPAATASLSALGDGNWKMGQGLGKGANKLGAAAERVEEGQLLEHYIFDVVSTLLTTLTTLSKSHRRPGLASIFLLNNVSHLRLNLLGNPSSTIDELLSKPTRDALNSNFRTAKAEYFNSNFGPVIGALNEDPVGSGKTSVAGVSLPSVPGTGGAKSQLKERWNRFWDALDETVERHRFARVLGDDLEGRGLLADEAVRLVKPAMERMKERGGKELNKNMGKYIKMTPEEVEGQIRGMYMYG